MFENGEGRQDFFRVMYEYCEEAPSTVFYDFACSLSVSTLAMSLRVWLFFVQEIQDLLVCIANAFQEYCLNREGDFFKDTKFYHDIFHSYNHKCGDTMKSEMGNAKNPAPHSWNTVRHMYH